ncbi:MAG TPA: hypothetical protein VJ643_07845 [Nitrososphaera sp.]|nr:hypothetical protein [Nitrososphaera sp.]
MEFIDGDGNIIVPKAVRPIIDLKETLLGSKKGAIRQYRYGVLHIREYDTHYSVHMDTVDPSGNPLGHLLVDAPEYLAGATAALIVGRRFGTTVYNMRKKEGKSTRDAVIDAILAGYIAGSATGNFVFNMTNSLKKKRSE